MAHGVNTSCIQVLSAARAIFFCAVILATVWPAELFAQRTIRLDKGALPVLAEPARKVIVATNNQSMSVAIPKGVAFAVRRGNMFTNIAANRTVDGTNIFSVKPGDVFVTKPPPTDSRPISTTGQSLPGAVHTTTKDGKEVEGRIEVSVHSELLVFNSTNRLFEGVLTICFASSNREAFKGSSFDVRLQTSAGLFVGVTNFTLNTSGKDTCQYVPVNCSLSRTSAHVTVISPELGTQKFTIDFEQPRWTERYQNVLVLLAQTLGGILLGALGGLVRAWQPPKAENTWTQVGTGGFCGLVLMLLGQVGVQKIFQIEGPVTTSVLLGLCAVFGYLGVKLLERFAPEEKK
jgi:hypothetical protein